MSRLPTLLLAPFFLAPVALAARAMDPRPTGFPVAVTGTVSDLYRAASGDILYCTLEGEVGRITTAGAVTVLATAETGPFPFALKAIVETAPGDLAVIDDAGEIWALPGGATPAVHRYDDAYMVASPSDMVVDTTGNFVIASNTPSNQLPGVNWVSSDGQRWGYYMVQHSPLFRPIQLAGDPTSGDLIVADQEVGGRLHCLDSDDPAHTLCALDTSTLYGYTAGHLDGDLAVESTGNVLVIAGGTLHRWNRLAGTASVVANGFAQLRGLTIAASSGMSATGWSAYVAEGGAPTMVREIPGVQPPASQVVQSLGSVPGRGILRTVYGSLKVYELEVDRDGHFLIGGDLWGASKSVRRVTVPGFNVSVIAGENDGITGRIEGIVQRPDGVIFALDSNGVIYEIRENPKSVSVYYADSPNLITAGKDLALGRDGTLYVADYEGWGVGEVRAILPGGASTQQISTNQGARALSSDPRGPGLLVSEWVNTGFVGKVTKYDFATQLRTNLPGFSGFNMTNGPSWGDGDSVVDVDGFVYVISEDDWSLSRWKPGRGGIERIGSSYLAHPSGLAIAPSMSGSSTTGWSLYASEYDYLYEIPDVAPPAPDIVDPTAPPVGALLGYTSPVNGPLRDLVPDPLGDGFLLPTQGGVLLHMASDGSVAPVAGGAQGLSGDLRAAAVRASDGHVIVARADGVLYDLDPMAGWNASVLFSDPSNQLVDVRGLAIDGLGRPLVVDRPAGRPVSKLFRLESGTLSFLAFTNRGVRPAVDPLTAEVWVTQEGHPFEPGGELLRVDALASPAAIGSWQKGPLYMQFRVGGLDGGIAFDADGNVYVAEGETGRIQRVDRATGARTVVSGNYANPGCLVLGPGTPGVAGPQGTSLFVLDGYVVYEVGVDGLPAPAPPAVNPGLAPPCDLRLSGFAAPGASISVRIADPAHPLKVFAIFPTSSGHLPGLPLAYLRDPTDTRIIASNSDYLWDSIGDVNLFPGFTGVLDASGQNPPGSGVHIPNIPELVFDAFIDMHWVVIDGMAQNFVAYTGATTQLFMGAQ